MKFSLTSRIKRFNSNATTEFYSHIHALLEVDIVKQLDTYIQHYSYTRLKHSIDVAYISFYIAKVLGWDSKSAARGGLLHDLFLYDRHHEDYTGERHLTTHPTIALENARLICELNKIEEDIIKKHMWLITITPPRYKEAFIVTFVDKYCAIHELCLSVFSRSKVRSMYVTEA